TPTQTKIDSSAHVPPSFYATNPGRGSLRPPPPVAAPLAGSLRAPSRGDPPLRGCAALSTAVALGNVCGAAGLRHPLGHAWLISAARSGSGGSPREGARSEERAEQRLAAGGAAPPTRSTLHTRKPTGGRAIDEVLRACSDL